MKDKKRERKIEGAEDDLAFDFDQLDLNYTDRARNEPSVQVVDKLFFLMFYIDTFRKKKQINTSQVPGRQFFLINRKVLQKNNNSRNLNVA